MSFLDSVLNLSPFRPLFQWKSAHQLAVLAYHGVDDPDLFEQHLIALKKKSRPIALEELLTSLNTGRSLPRSSVLITFDDGYRSILESAMPVMRRHGIPGVIFVVAGLLDTNTPVWTAEVKELAGRNGALSDDAKSTPQALVRMLKKMEDHERLEAIVKLREYSRKPVTPVPQLRADELRILEANGIDVGNHTMTHPCLTRCSTEKIYREIAGAHDALTYVLGHAPTAFAYPNGDADERAIQVLAELGYEAGFLFDHRMSHLQRANRHCISRLRINSDTSMARFHTIMSGLHPTVHHAMGRD